MRRYIVGSGVGGGLAASIRGAGLSLMRGSGGELGRVTDQIALAQSAGATPNEIARIIDGFISYGPLHHEHKVEAGTGQNIPCCHVIVHTIDPHYLSTGVGPKTWCLVIHTEASVHLSPHLLSHTRSLQRREAWKPLLATSWGAVRLIGVHMHVDDVASDTRQAVQCGTFRPSNCRQRDRAGRAAMSHAAEKGG